MKAYSFMLVALVLLATPFKVAAQFPDLISKILIIIWDSWSTQRREGIDLIIRNLQ